MMMSATPFVLLLFAAQHGLWQAAGQATGAAAAATGQSQLLATTKEGALAAARGDKNTETLLHGQKQATNMLRSMLMANSQQMFAINNLQKEVARMRTRLDKHEQAVSDCKKKLKKYESEQESLATDAVLADTIEAPVFLQSGHKHKRRHGHHHRLRRHQALPNPDPQLEYDATNGKVMSVGPGTTEQARRKALDQINQKVLNSVLGQEQQQPQLAPPPQQHHVDHVEKAAPVVPAQQVDFGVKQQQPPPFSGFVFDEGAPADALNWESPEDHDSALQDTMYDMTGSEYQILKKSENTPEKIAERNLNAVNRKAEERRHRFEEEEDPDESNHPDDQSDHD